ncbi:MAG: membrane-binding protein [Alistipes sp.]|nr:membrane-binding protein [Alistipes sp.]
MKKLLFTISIILSTHYILSAQDRTDTLYYDRNWRTTNDKTFADYYRIAKYPQDSLQERKYIDFYITGEIQSKGQFISIDNKDDKYSIFDGLCESYYKNGKTAEIKNFRKGVLDGEYKSFNEDGLINYAGWFINGKKHGIHTKFINKDRYIQKEYSEGELTSDYYIMANSDGLMIKRKHIDDSIIWETPAINERQTKYIDGRAWQYYSKNGLTIALTSTNYRSYGKWHKLDIVITNNSLQSIRFDPSRNISAQSTDKKSITTYLDVWSCDRYIKKVNRVQLAFAILAGFSEGLASSNAGYSTSYTTSYYNGRTNNYGYRGYPSRNYTGSATHVSRTYNGYAAYQASVISQQRLTDFCNALNLEKENKRLEYIKENTIYPGETIAGYVLVKRINGENAKFVIDILGAKYSYDYFFGKIKKQKSKRGKTLKY